MFRNLVESGSHTKDFKRKGTFFIGTLAFYSVILCAAGVVSIYAYNARIDDGDDVEILALMRVASTSAPEPQQRRAEPRPAGENKIQAARVKVLVVMTPYVRPVAATDSPILNRKMPVIIDPNADGFIPDNVGGVPGGLTTGTSAGTDGNGSAPYVPPSGEEAPARVVKQEAQPPAEQRPKVDKPVSLPSTVISSKAISKPVPQYPEIAKRVRAQGSVAVQILIDEYGRVISAQATSGHPLLQKTAVEAAYRARFSPTLLSNRPVRVSGIIYYNFVLQ